MALELSKLVVIVCSRTLDIDSDTCNVECGISFNKFQSCEIKNFRIRGLKYNKQWFINWGSDEYYLITVFKNSDKFWPKKRIAMEKQNEEILALLESAQVLLEQGRDSIKKGKLPMQIEIR